MLAVLAAWSSAAHGATVTWTGLGSGSNAGKWSSPLNWSSNPSLPGVNDDVVIPAGFSGIQLNAGVQSIRSITCSSPVELVFDTLSVSAPSVFHAAVTLNGATLTGAGDITINANSTWVKGKMTGAGKLIVAAGKSLAINPSSTPTLSRPIEVFGVLRLQSGQLAFNSGSITVRSGGNLSLEGATQAYVSSGSGNDVVIDPGATVTKSAAGTYQFSGGVRLLNAGVVTIQAGVLDVASATSTTGNYNVFTNATLLLSANHDLLNGSSVTGGGICQVTGQTLTVTGNSSVSNPIFTQTVTGTGTLTITGLLGEWRQGTFSGTGTTVIASNAILALNTSSHTLARTLEIRGTVNWTLGAIGMGASSVGGTINNISGGVFNISAVEQCIGNPGTSAINNSGTISKTGTGTTPVVMNGGTLTFNNNGLVQVQQGTLKLEVGGTHSGNFNVSTGATLTTGFSHTFTSTGQVTGSGTWLLPSAPAVNATLAGVISFGGTVDLRAGTLAFNNSTFLTHLQHSGGTLTGSGQIAVSGNASWSAGTIDGTGLLLIASGGTYVINATTGLTLRRNFENQGTTTWTAGNISLSPPTALPAATPVTLTNKSGGLFICAPGASFFAVNGSQASFTNLQGTVRKTGSAAVSFDRDAAPAACVFNNTLGTVNVEGGAFNIKTGGASSGIFNLSLGTTLNLTNGYSFANGSEVKGAGTLVLPSGPAITLAGTVKWSNTNFSGQLINGTGDLTITGISNWTSGSLSANGTFTIANGATLNILGSAHTLEQRFVNQGTVNWTAGPISINNVELLNDFPGVFNMNVSESIIGSGGSPVFRNKGAIIKTGPGTVTFANSLSPMTLDNTGALDVYSGVVSIPSTLVQRVDNTLTGGTWLVGDTGVLDIPGLQLKTLNGYLEMQGPGSTFAPLRYLSVINGGFALSQGRNFRATPNGGELVNAGFISIRPGSELSIIGSYTQLPGAVFESLWGVPPISANGSLLADTAGQLRVVGFGLLNLDGEFHGAVEDGLLTECSESRPALSAPYVFGSFSSATVQGTVPGRYFSVDSSGNIIKMVSSTLADYNRDGFIDFGDFDAFVVSFEAGEIASDINADGFIDFTDFDDFVALFENGC
jgi:fibronectin-binding autotransporter adhesin